jgi:hypothetical protein
MNYNLRKLDLLIVHFPFAHFEDDDECGGNITANG